MLINSPAQALDRYISSEYSDLTRRPRLEVCYGESELLDTDGDGVLDNLDNCPTISNPDQADSDSDGIGDACDVCANDPENDADGDGVCGDVDNCPNIYNPGQGDSDGDGIGDACEELPEPTCVTVQRGAFGEAADGYIWQSRPTSGSFTDISFSTGLFNSGETRALIHFGLGFLPSGVTIQSATLGLDQYLPGSGETVNVYRITQAWSEGEPTWNSFASSHDAVSSASFSSVGGPITVDLTNLVSAWANDAYPNYGLMLINSPAQALDRYISSEYSDLTRRPRLEVCYEAP